MARRGAVTGRRGGRLLSLRLPEEMGMWFDEEAARRNVAVSVVLRAALEPVWRRYGLPPLLWKHVEAAMKEQGLTLDQFISETLRRVAVARATRAEGIKGDRRGRLGA